MHQSFKDSLKHTKDFGTMEDIFRYCQATLKGASDKAIDLADALFEHSSTLATHYAMANSPLAENFHNLARSTCLFLAPYRFDRYCLYMEWDREPHKRFYLPRREVLLPVVQDLQDLNDRVILFLSLSTPPRVGKSTLGCFFVSWQMGKEPEKANVMSGHSDKLTKGFYKEVYSLLVDPQYNWQEIFPDVKVAGISAEDEAIHLNSVRRFPTLTCRSIGGTLTGAVEVGNLLYCDDLIEDLEEAVNLDRLQNKYDAYANQLKDRMKLNTIQLMIGTRWAPTDVQGRIKEQYRDDPQYRFRVIPALNEHGESNFNYPFKLGFDTAYYLDMKASIDFPTWSAKYMGDPSPREGLLYPEDELSTYTGVLPDGEPIVYAPADVAWGGGDYFSMPFLYYYPEDGSVYVHDVIYNNGDKSVTRPIVVSRMMQHLPAFTRFEANNGGHEYADEVDKQLREMDVKLNISSRKAPVTSNKLVRMLNGATEARKWIFLDRAHRSKEYTLFVRHLTSFNQLGIGKQPDDAPDSLGQGYLMMNQGAARVEAFRRPF